MTTNDLTRPIIGIENRTAQEVFDIMADRIRRAALTLPSAGEAEPVAWPIDTDDQVEALARECDWDNRKYMTPADYAIWCERMRKFARLAHPSPSASEAQVRVPNAEAIAEAIWNSHELGEWSQADRMDRGFHLRAAQAVLSLFSTPEQGETAPSPQTQMGSSSVAINGDENHSVEWDKNENSGRSEYENNENPLPESARPHLDQSLGFPSEYHHSDNAHNPSPQSRATPPSPSPSPRKETER